MTTTRSTSRAPWCRRLAALGVAALATAACGKDDQPATESDTAAAATTPAPTQDSGMAATSAPPITDILIITVPDRLALVGRRVTISGVAVQTVAGPRTFWVGPDPTRRLFVVLDSAATAAGADSTRGPKAGQTVAVSGVIRPLPTELAAMASAWSLSAPNVETLRPEQIYLAADSVSVVPE